jgi:hypothetical protein
LSSSGSLMRRSDWNLSGTKFHFPDGRLARDF